MTDTVTIPKAKYEATLKDAQRYKHLRDHMFYKDTQFGEPWMACEIESHNLDEAIDKAMEQT